MTANESLSNAIKGLSVGVCALRKDSENQFVCVHRMAPLVDEAQIGNRSPRYVSTRHLSRRLLFIGLSLPLS